jgi:hypothetical protein
MRNEVYGKKERTTRTKWARRDAYVILGKGLLGGRAIPEIAERIPLPTSLVISQTFAVRSPFLDKSPQTDG